MAKTLSLHGRNRGFDSRLPLLLIQWGHRWCGSWASYPGLPGSIPGVSTIYQVPVEKWLTPLITNQLFVGSILTRDLTSKTSLSVKCPLLIMSQMSYYIEFMNNRS